MMNYKVRNKRSKVKSILVIGLFIVMILMFGVAIVAAKAADWGAGHQVIRQPVIAQWVKFQLPYRIEKVQPEIIIPVMERADYEDFSTTEQKIIDRWGFRDGVMAIAIFDCGESGLYADAVSMTGDLGIAQINWPINGGLINEKLGYGPADMFDVDKNLDAAHLLWDRGDGIEGNGIGTWDPWSGFNNGAYLACFR